MLTEKTRTGHISVSARCFSVILSLMLALPCHALSVSGVPEWLEGAVVRSVNAIWSEIPDSPEIDREGTLSLVASRLFAGYDVEIISGRYEPAVIFTAKKDNIISPDINITLPELRRFALQWFKNDIAGLQEEISRMTASIPQSALTWADDALRGRIGEIVSEIIPGWEFSQQIYIATDRTEIHIAFRPSNQVIQAVKPSLYSRTIPAVFLTDLEARLIPEFSPLVGVPVEWAELHVSEAEMIAHDFLADRHAIENMRADMSINFTVAPVSRLEAVVDSQTLMFELWFGGYVGIEGKYPELGTFFAVGPDAMFEPEIYAELILSLNDFGTTHRIGGRFEPVKYFWLGIENEWPENEYFFRLHYNPIRIKRPYLWWRWSPSMEVHEAAAGYRIDEHISIEIYYYDAGDDKIGLRGMWHL